jgi:hypothetical protein
MGLTRLFATLDAFGYAQANGNTCIQLGSHGSLTAVSPAQSWKPKL